MNNISPSDPDHSTDVAKKGHSNDVAKEHHEDKDKSSDARMSATNLRAVHEKACALVKLADEGSIDEKLSKSWIQSKLTLADDYLTAIHDYIVFDKEVADSDEHGGDKEHSDDMGGGFVISVQKALD